MLDGKLGHNLSVLSWANKFLEISFCMVKTRPKSLMTFDGILNLVADLTALRIKPVFSFKRIFCCCAQI